MQMSSFFFLSRLYWLKIEKVTISMIKSQDIHCVGNRTWAIEFGKSLLVMDPGFEHQPTLNNLLELQEDSGLTVSHLFLSHDHSDHADNLDDFFAFQDKGFLDFTLVAHENSKSAQQAQKRGRKCLLVNGDRIITLSGGEAHVLATPGHTPFGDDISVWIPEKRSLFAGDLPQPQGPSYEECTFHSAFSNHTDGETVLRSLDKLLQLPFDLLLMGHEGDCKESKEGHEALSITQRVLRRTKELAERLTQENPGEDFDTYVEWIFDTISWERGMAKEKSEGRKSEGHRGPCERLSPYCYYNLYDIPSIKFFVSKALSS